VETRTILEAGANPLLEDCAPPEGRPRVADCGLTAAADSSVMHDDMAPIGRNRRDPLSRPVDLDGLKEIIGLALGAPEFQRR
jgi:hypothetical protein